MYSSPCYEKLVNEFIMSFLLDFNVEGSREYMKVYVRGKCVNFSPSIINEYLGRSKLAGTKKVLLNDKIYK